MFYAQNLTLLPTELRLSLLKFGLSWHIFKDHKFVHIFWLFMQNNTNVWNKTKID